MHVTLAQQDVALRADLDLGLVVGVEEDAVAELHGAGVRAHRDDLGPGEPPVAERGRGRDDDAAGGPALTGLLVELHEHPVVQHPDRVLVRHGAGPGQRVTRRITRSRPTKPATPPTTLRMFSVRGLPSASTNTALAAATSRRTTFLGLVRSTSWSMVAARRSRVSSISRSSDSVRSSATAAPRRAGATRPR